MGVRVVRNQTVLVIDGEPFPCRGFSLDSTYGAGAGKIDIDIGCTLTLIGFDVSLNTDDAIYIQRWPRLPTAALAPEALLPHPAE